MEINLEFGDIAKTKTDALIVNFFKGQKQPTGPTSEVNKATNNLLFEHLAEQEFDSSLGETVVFHLKNELPAKHVIVVGLGKPEGLTPSLVRVAAAAAIAKAKELKATTVTTLAHGIDLAGFDPALTVQMTVLGTLLGSYEFDRYKTKERAKRQKQTLAKLTVIESDQQKISAMKDGLKKGEAIASAILNSRDIVNEPPSKITPTSLVKAAKEIASLSKTITVTVFDRERLEREGYTALLAVAAGSEEPPYLIHLHYAPKLSKRTIAIVGKGVTFDCGGLGIKPWNAMLSMKTDMAGAANVLGIFQALAELEAAGFPCPLEIHGIIPTTENMISGKAMRPDDIIETKSGKTIEIVHTDAEGRLILSDALTFATSLKPDYMIDYATLTGAAIVALGRDYGVYMGNDQTLLGYVREASQQTGELAWELPLPEGYERFLESAVADLQNASPGKDGPGAIMGGLFLREFVNDIPWVHFDIAGPSWSEESKNPLTPRGATGYGIALGLRLIELLS